MPAAPEPVCRRCGCPADAPQCGHCNTCDVADQRRGPQRCPVSNSGACLRTEDDDPECEGACPFTVDEAREEVERLSTELYEAQDALAFAGECLTIWEREQPGQPVPADTVRRWLEGAKCGRKLAAELRRAFQQVQAAVKAAHDGSLRDQLTLTDGTATDQTTED